MSRSPRSRSSGGLAALAVAVALAGLVAPARADEEPAPAAPAPAPAPAAAEAPAPAAPPAAAPPAPAAPPGTGAAVKKPADPSGVATPRVEPPKAFADDGAASLLWQLLRTAVALGIVCAIAYFGLKLFGARLAARGAGTVVKVVDQGRLDAKTTLYLVEVAGQYILVGVGDGGVQALTPVALDADRIRAALGQRGARPFASVLEALASARPPAGAGVGEKKPESEVRP